MAQVHFRTHISSEEMNNEQWLQLKQLIFIETILVKKINTTKFSISSCIFAHLKISLIVNNNLDQIFETKENKH